MDDKTTVLIEKLAEKLGTTAEYLWEVLLRQAFISGVINLVFVLTMILVSVALVRFVANKTTKLLGTDRHGHPRPEWVDDDAFMAQFAVGGFLIITVFAVFNLIPVIVAAFFNPEYLALSLILKP